MSNNIGLLGNGVVQSGLTRFFLVLSWCVFVCAFANIPLAFVGWDLQMPVWLVRVRTLRFVLGPWASKRGVTRVPWGARPCVCVCVCVLYASYDILALGCRLSSSFFVYLKLTF